MLQQGWGGEDWPTGGPALANQLIAGRGGAETKPSPKVLLFKIHFIHGTSPCNVAPDIDVVRFVSIPTSYFGLEIYFPLPAMLISKRAPFAFIFSIFH
jgi:hypothetical protein